MLAQIGGTGFLSRLGISISQSIHHFRESAPVNPLRGLTPRAGPKQRAPSDLQLPELEILAINLQRERGLRLRKARVGDFSLHFISVRQ
jgi:hypothetical protein